MFEKYKAESNNNKLCYTRDFYRRLFGVWVIACSVTFIIIGLSSEHFTEVVNVNINVPSQRGGAKAMNMFHELHSLSDEIHGQDEQNSHIHFISSEPMSLSKSANVVSNFKNIVVKKLRSFFSFSSSSSSSDTMSSLKTKLESNGLVQCCKKIWRYIVSFFLFEKTKIDSIVFNDLQHENTHLKILYLKLAQKYALLQQLMNKGKDKEAIAIFNQIESQLTKSQSENLDLQHKISGIMSSCVCGNTLSENQTPVLEFELMQCRNVLNECIFGSDYILEDVDVNNIVEEEKVCDKPQQKHQHQHHHQGNSKKTKSKKDKHNAEKSKVVVTEEITETALFPIIVDEKQTEENVDESMQVDDACAFHMEVFNLCLKEESECVEPKKLFHHHCKKHF